MSRSETPVRTPDGRLVKGAAAERSASDARDSRAALAARSARSGWHGLLPVRPLKLDVLDLPLLLALVVVPLNSEAGLGPLVTANTKGMALGLVLLAAIAIGTSCYRWRPTVRSCGAVVVYASVLLVASLQRPLPSQRYILLATFLVLVGGFVVHEAHRPGRFFGIVFWASTVHLLIAAGTGKKADWGDGVLRLSGGSHPITLGFESACVLIVAIAYAWRSAAPPAVRVGFGAIAVLAVYTLNGASSLQGLLGGLFAVALVVMLIPGRAQWGRVLAAVAGAVLVWTFASAGLLAFVTEGRDPSALRTATGRTDIWERLITELLAGRGGGPLGFGFAAISDGTGPDADLFRASLRQNAENSVLQVLVDAGPVGLAAWLVVLVLVGIAVWRAERTTRSLVLSSLPILLVSFAASGGLSGEGVQWWWLLALWSLARTVPAVPRAEPGAPRTRRGGRGDQQPGVTTSDFRVAAS